MVSERLGTPDIDYPSRGQHTETFFQNGAAEQKILVSPGIKD